LVDPDHPPLLQADETSPVMLARADGGSDFVICVDHAGRRIPRQLGDLGLAPDDLSRHIAWDIGAWAVALQLAERLDAALIGQAYSRLVIDCNRDPGAPSAIPEISETTPIPGNLYLTPEAIAERRRAVFEPYHAGVSALLDGRAARGRRTALIALHSMTDVYLGVRRPMQCAVLYNRDARLARPLLDVLRREPGLTVGENTPYDVSDETDYTIPRHGEGRGLVHVEFEMRQDLILDADGQAEWADRLARAFNQADAILREAHPDA
jgi:predicted N-formylglutamate amidohydrolase